MTASVMISIISLGASLLLSVGGIVWNMSKLSSKVTCNSKDIEELKGKQNITDTLLTNISNTLTSINTKVDLILSGKVVISSSKDN